MPMNPGQLRKLITDVLITMDMYSKNAVELLMLTAAQESHCGEYIEQLNGPALGIFQMEPNTYEDTFSNYLMYKPRLLNKVKDLFVLHDYVDIPDLNLRGNLILQIAMARIYYMRFSEQLPDHNNVEAMAQYWKKYWNTPKGKGHVTEAKNNYMRYAV